MEYSGFPIIPSLCGFFAVRLKSLRSLVVPGDLNVNADALPAAVWFFVVDFFRVFAYCFKNGLYPLQYHGTGAAAP